MTKKHPENNDDSYRSGQRTADELEVLLAQEKDSHRKTKIKLKAKEREIHAITQSNSYKIARILAVSKHGAKIVVNHAKDLNPKRVRMLTQNKRHVRSVYQSAAFISGLEVKSTSDLAVVIHMYYPEMRDVFARKLKNIAHLKYDLFITIPDTKADKKSLVEEAFPNAHVVLTPNCGRDVLPFVQVMKTIKKHGYTKVLKLHSKRSPHREDGEEWRDKILDSLLSADTQVMKDIQKVLGRKKTAIVGPDGEYVSLLVNFSATGHYLKNLVGKIIDTKLASELVSTSDEYGFFAGTMFWARIDAIMPVIDSVAVGDFEPELGQEDSTLAHALERLLNVIPELQGRDMYELREGAVVKIGYHTSNIPDWSEVALEED